MPIINVNDKWQFRDDPGMQDFYCVETLEAKPMRLIPYCLTRQSEEIMVREHNRVIDAICRRVERLSEMHKTEVRENKELWKENQRLKETL